MAVFDAVLSPAAKPAINFTVGAGASSAERTDFGAGEIFAMNSDKDIMIKFGVPGSVPAATAADFRIPAGVTVEFTMDRNWTSYKIFNNGAATATIWAQPLNPR